MLCSILQILTRIANVGQQLVICWSLSLAAGSVLSSVKNWSAKQFSVSRTIPPPMRVQLISAAGSVTLCNVTSASFNGSWITCWVPPSPSGNAVNASIVRVNVLPSALWTGCSTCNFTYSTGWSFRHLRDVSISLVLFWFCSAEPVCIRCVSVECVCRYVCRSARIYVHRQREPNHGCDNICLCCFVCVCVFILFVLSAVFAFFSHAVIVFAQGFIVLLCISFVDLLFICLIWFCCVSISFVLCVVVCCVMHRCLDDESWRMTYDWHPQLCCQGATTFFYLLFCFALLCCYLVYNLSARKIYSFS